MRFETERMMVRSFQEGDLPDLQEILGDAQTMVYMEPPYTLEQTARFLQDFCIGRKGALAAEDKASGRGHWISFCVTKFRMISMKLGGFSIAAFGGRAMPMRPAAAWWTTLFCLHAHKLLAETIDPLKSAGLMRKLGMELEGVQRGKSKTMGGQWVDCRSVTLLSTRKQ